MKTSTENDERYVTDIVTGNIIHQKICAAVVYHEFVKDPLEKAKYICRYTKRGCFAFQRFRITGLTLFFEYDENEEPQTFFDYFESPYIPKIKRRLEPVFDFKRMNNCPLYTITELIYPMGRLINLPGKPHPRVLEEINSTP